MSNQENATIVRRLFEEMDKGNLAIITEVCAPTYTVHFPGTPGPLNREAAAQFFDMFYTAFPGLGHTIEDMVPDQDKVAARLTIRGTQGGAFQGIPATGKQIDVGAINIFHFANGQIAEHWVEYDAVGMLQQLGVVPTPQG